MFKSYKIILFFGLSLMLIHKSFSSNLGDNTFIELRSSYSILMAHRPNLKGYPNGHFLMSEINIGKKLGFEKTWYDIYHHPNVGLTLFYTDIGKNKYTGFALSTMAYIQFPYARFKKSNFNFKLALGPGWVEKKFDRVNNYKNVVTGTHLNAAIQLTQSFEWHIAKQQSLSIGVCLTHFSNGAFKLPNLGINLAGLQLGYHYNFNETEIVAIDRPAFEKKMKYLINYSAGIKQVYPVLGPQYFLSNLSAFALYNYHEKGSTGIILDFFKDASLYNQMKYDTDSTNNNKNNLQIGLGAVYEIEFGKFTIPLIAGFYVYNNYKVLPIMYLKFALSYQITKHFCANFNLKSHYAKADYFSYGVGYKF
ncbi:MAG TPA: acyloxyacyl hydrolase [Bacteroidia bacterium]|nr:acyloxyacyl hydrolase [Bacteroidia bacterium]